MMGWRFYPLAELPRRGILVSPSRKPAIAYHLTLDEAKAIAAAKRKSAA